MTNKKSSFLDENKEKIKKLSESNQKLFLEIYFQSLQNSSTSGLNFFGIVYGSITILISVIISILYQIKLSLVLLIGMVVFLVLLFYIGKFAVDNTDIFEKIHRKNMEEFLEFLEKLEIKQKSN